MPEPPYLAISQALQEGRVVPFLGAGASSSCRPADGQWTRTSPFLPRGVELSRHLARRANFFTEDERERADLLKVSAYYEQQMGRDELRRELQSVLGGSKYTPGDLHAFLAGTRVLVCALPLTRETRGLLGDEALSVLPRGAHVVNVSRGGIVDENALLDAVARGHLAGAALDVFGREPLPSDHALWAERRIRVTPHIAATPDAETAARQILDNLARARRGEPLRNAVDRERGY